MTARPALRALEPSLKKSHNIGVRVYWVYGTLAAAGVAWNIGLPVGTLVRLFALGLLLWTPLEYVLHRYVFHRLAPHYQHHESPAELRYIFAPLWFSGIAAIALFALFALAAGSWQRGALIDAGVISGYLCYEALHVWIHSPRAGGALLTALRRHHYYHHFADDTKCYGVVTPFWDHIFRTLPAGGK